VNGAITTYYHQDQLGSTRALTNSSGTAVASYNFDSYGNLTTTPPGVTNPFQFAGQYLDNESNLLYLRARYYDAGVGQFISRDPLAGLTRQPYVYVANNPLNLTDPSGRCPWCIGAIAGAIVGAVADTAWQYQRNGGSFKNFSWGEAGLAAAGGAIVGGTLGAATGWVAGGGLSMATAGEAAGAGGAGSTILYRAVNDVELQDIVASGTYRIAGASAQFGKYFYPTLAQAQSFCAKGWASTVTASRFANSVVQAAERLSPAGEGEGLFIGAEHFPHGPVSIY